MRKIMMKTAVTACIAVFAFLLLGCDQILEVFYPEETKMLSGDFVEVEAVVKFDDWFSTGDLGQNPLFIAAVPYNDYQGIEAANWEGRQQLKFTQPTDAVDHGGNNIVGRFQLRRDKTYVLVAWQEQPGNTSEAIDESEPSAQLYFMEQGSTDMTMSSAKVYIDRDFPDKATAIAGEFGYGSRIPEAMLWELSPSASGGDLHEKWDLYGPAEMSSTQAAQGPYAYGFSRPYSSSMPGLRNLSWSLKSADGYDIYVDDSLYHTVTVPDGMSVYAEFQVDFSNAYSSKDGNYIDYSTVGSVMLEVTVNFTDGRQSTRQMWISFYQDYSTGTEASDGTWYSMNIDIWLDSSLSGRNVQVSLSDGVTGVRNPIAGGLLDTNGYLSVATGYDYQYKSGGSRDWLLIQIDMNDNGDFEDDYVYAWDQIYLANGEYSYWTYIVPGDFSGLYY